MRQLALIGGSGSQERWVGGLELLSCPWRGFQPRSSHFGKLLWNICRVSLVVCFGTLKEINQKSPHRAKCALKTSLSLLHIHWLRNHQLDSLRLIPSHFIYLLLFIQQPSIPEQVLATMNRISLNAAAVPGGHQHAISLKTPKVKAFFMIFWASTPT